MIDLGENYEYAVVSDPSQEYLWILSRTPILPQAQLQGILDRLKADGYDLAKLKYTEHPKVLLDAYQNKMKAQRLVDE